MDLGKKRNYTLAKGEEIEGMKLVSADYEEERAVLRMNGQEIVLKLQSRGNKSRPEAQERKPAKKQEEKRSYIERRKARRKAQQQASRRPEPKKPENEGEELKQRLQEVQMDAIRTGKPPLPIPLTPEMDEQLVEEGVLPPLEE